MNVKKMNLRWLLSILLVLICSGSAQDAPNPYSISHISPKSIVYEKGKEETLLQSSMALVFDKKSQEHESKIDALMLGKSTVSNDEKYINNELNDIENNSIKTSEVISPTKTRNFNDGKKESENSFLVKRGRQVQVRPPISEMSTVMMTALTNSSRPRQNNPDIQDIITGIVKLLNGNVNVHQGSRSPMHNNRINNRGPPRIAEAQVPFNENVQDKNPFDQPVQQQPQHHRPDAPLRPFLTGVPVPEQIVPSMQQNYRPGFVSQNRPPWRRPKPRPPISRRPIPAFNRPIPTHIEEDPKVELENYDEEIIKEEIELTTVASENENETVSISPTITTIIQTTSEVNLVKDDISLDKIIPESSSVIESSINENTLSELVIETPILTSSITPSSVIKENPNTIDAMRTAFHPRPGLVLDDPEFKPGNKNMYTQRNTKPFTSNQNRDDFGFGEIFDVTLSAIQGPNGGSQQTVVNVNPYKNYQSSDIVLFEPSGDQNFVSIDGKRTYFNLFSDSTEASSTAKIEPTKVFNPGNTGTGYVIAETEPTPKKPHHSHHSPQRPKIPSIHSNQPQVRIDTCILGDDSTCDQAQNEKCKIEHGISSCNCKPGYARRKHREICRKIVSLVVSLRIDKYNEKKITLDSALKETSELYRSLKYESFRAIDSAMSMTPFSDEFVDAKIFEIYKGDASKGLAGVFVNFTIMLEENAQTLQPTIKHEIQRHLIGVIHRRNNNIGSSSLYVESPVGSVSAVQDLDECTSPDLNDCDSDASCANTFGSYRCQCKSGFKDPYADQVHRAGRECQTCSDMFCNNRGTCSYDENGNQVCTCSGSYYGSTCEIDGEILTVAIGASVAAIIIIILTLVCLIMWSRRWQREHKSAMVGSPVFGYLGNMQQKSGAIGTIPYQVGLEERIRWAQIADVMAQANHYAVEPVVSARVPGMYPGYSSNMNTLSGHHGHHGGTLPPIPLPRLNALNRGSGIRTLENSSSSEEEDRTEMLNRNFHVPRPKSRSNASVTSGIYYDVDYLPSGEHHLYSSGAGNNQIPLSTYGRPPSTATYYK